MAPEGINGIMTHDQTSPFLRPFLSHWLLERIGTPALQPGMAHRCHATILYADLNGFTRLTATFASQPDGAEHLHDALTQFFDALIDTIIAYGGDVATIAGDALTAWWPDRYDIEVAQRCGAALLTVMKDLPAIETPQGPFRLDMRIGISAGITYIVLAGLPIHGLYLVIYGPALRAATRAEQLAKPGTIHIIEAPRLEEHTPPAIDTSIEPTTTISWEHFLPPTFAERLRSHDLIPEYRRCVPAFANFALPVQPEDLHRLVAHVQAVVLRWGGWLNEVEVGDKGAVFVMLFGAPVARGDDPSRAVGCCLELRDRGLIDRAAVTVGILFVGAVGSHHRRVYTAQGDDMNLAAHLMQRAHSGEVLVSGRIRSEIMGRYQTSNVTHVITKGHREGVPVAQVISGGVRMGRGVALQRYLPHEVRLVGRTEERRVLHAAAQRAANGHLSVILLEGESGIGKSYILQDLAATWIDHGHRGYSSECVSGGVGMPLLAWRPILADICGIDEGASLKIQREQFEDALLTIPPIDPMIQQSLAWILGVSEEVLGEGVSLLSDPEEQVLLIEVVIELIRAQIQLGPLLIILEDIHWADTLSLQVAAHLLRAPVGEDPFPLCLTLSHRPLDSAVPPALTALRNDRRTTRVRLGRLSSTQSVELIRALLGVTDVHPELRQHIERQTEGQPLFIKEYLRVLQQQHLACIEDGVAKLKPNALTMHVSSSAQGIIQARVDRLDEPTRLTLKAAAVIGRSFPFRLLKKIHPAQPSDHALLSQLTTLIHLNIIDLELEDPERVYRFMYGITHEVAYTSLLFGQRRQLHAAVVRWYEQTYAADIVAGRAAMAVYDVLISHLRRAEEWQRLTRYARIAAEQAAQQFSNTAALRYVEQALVMTTEATERVDLLLLRVMINDRVENHSTQSEDLETIHQLSNQLQDPLRLLYVQYYHLGHLLAVGMYGPVIKKCQQFEETMVQIANDQSMPDRLRQIRLLRAGSRDICGAAYAANGDLRRAQEHHRQALVMALDVRMIGENNRYSPYRWLDSRMLAGRCFYHLGQIALYEGNLEAATENFHQALAQARTCNNWSGEVRARAGLSQVYLFQQNVTMALGEANRALATSKAVGDRTGQAIILRQFAAISAAQDEYDEALRRAMHALTISSNMRIRMLEVQIWHDIARFATAQGLDDDAAAARHEAERLRVRYL